jgi:uncharacterized protein involved in exopolysaccharide biosynthesis
MSEDPSLNDALERLEIAERAAQAAADQTSRADFTIAEVVTAWCGFLWRDRRAFARVGVLFLALGLTAAFLIPARYTARATILPPESSGGGLSRLLSALPMAAAQMLGSTGESKMVDLYVDIAKSQTILSDVLAAPYDGRTFREALQAGSDTPDWQLMEDLRLAFAGSKHPRTQLVMFELTLRDPKLAAALLNEMLGQMDRFFRFRMATTDNMQRKMIETRLAEVTDTLRLAEEALRQFKESNRLTMLSPKLMLDEGRLMRQVEINNAVYVELTKQLELARISEAENAPVMNILDYASVPDRRSGPSRVMILLSALGIGFGFTFVMLRFGGMIPSRVRKPFEWLAGTTDRS